MHPSKAIEIDEASLLTMKRQLHSMQQFLFQVTYLQNCLADNVILPNDNQPHTRPMSAEDRVHFEKELMKARHSHRQLSASLKALVDKHGGKDHVAILMKNFQPGVGQGPSALPPNPPAMPHPNQQARPHSSNAHQVPGTQQILPLSGHQPHLINQHQPQHPHHLGPGQQPLSEHHQPSPHSGSAIPSNQKQVHVRNT
jgi:hypothetical protein